MVLNSPAPDTLTRVIREAMEEQGKTVLGLATATNIPRTTLDRRLRGSDFTTKELFAIARELGTTMPELWLRVEAIEGSAA